MRALNSLNFQHLLYFWTVASEGGVLRATRTLNVTASTISGQLKALEASLGTPLFHRRGRRLQLTPAGELVRRYANDMFTAAREMTLALDGETTARPQRFAIGISDSLPKLTTFRLIEPAFHLDQPLATTIRIDKTARLVNDLATHELDLVIADEPLAPALNIKAFNHSLGQCTVHVFGIPRLIQRVKRGFPHSLAGAPMVLQTPNTALRRSLDHFLAAEGITPRIACEVEDIALLQELGGQGIGLFAAPAVVSDVICRRYGVRVAGELPAVIERFFAISIERKIRNPAVAAISSAARNELFR
jgi:LysR family transcriptional regulator, transcriptional activator of nhaA